MPLQWLRVPNTGPFDFLCSVWSYDFTLEADLEPHETAVGLNVSLQRAKTHTTASFINTLRMSWPPGFNTVLRQIIASLVLVLMR